VFLQLLPATNQLFAQQINRKILEFNQICAGGPNATKPGEAFNEYQVFFSITGFASDITFRVQLSDPLGSFSTPTETTVLAPLPQTPADTPTDKTLVFAVPINLVGSNTYKLRVISSTGITSQPFIIKGSTSTTSFPAYYKSYNDAFLINENNPTVSFCSGGSVTLTVYNPTPSNPNSSPANFPGLKYNWYKNGVLIAGETNSFLVVNSDGEYYSELNYGGCTEVNNRSQAVIATSSSGGGGVTINSSQGNPFCAGSDTTTLSVSAGNSYVWKQNGIIIPGATSQTYSTSAAGVYSCDVDFGGCKATGTIDLKTNGSISANGAAVAEGEILRIDQGDTVTVTANTNVSNPTFQWFLNNAPISGATQSTLDITVAGNYKVTISGCDLSFKVSYDALIDYNVPKIPNIISPNNDGTNDTWIIPDVYSNTNTHVMILSSYGEIVFDTDNYDNYNGWPQATIEFKNFNPIYYYIITPTGGSAKKGSITLLK
jgi:gliding motility-associated-like protein